MEKYKHNLEEILRQCTVRVVAVQARFGTGFFVAPGHILTCAHVVQSAHTDPSIIRVERDDHKFTVQSLTLKPDPDLALLKIDFVHHPCVYLHVAVDIGEELYSYGYTDEYPEGDSALFVCEGPAGKQGPLLKLKDAQVRPGLSGAPLLNRRTGGVCGIIKKSRGRNSNMGGRAIPASTILSELNVLEGMQWEFHIKNRCWINCLDQQQLQLIKWGEVKIDQLRSFPSLTYDYVMNARESITHARELLNRKGKIWGDELKVANGHIKRTIGLMQELTEKSSSTPTNVPSKHHHLVKELQYVIEHLEILVASINELIFFDKELSFFSEKKLRDIRVKIDTLQNRLNSISDMVIKP